MDVVLHIEELEKGHKLKVVATQLPQSQLLVNLSEKRTATKIQKDQRLCPGFNQIPSKSVVTLGVIIVSLQEMAPVHLRLEPNIMHLEKNVDSLNQQHESCKINKSLTCFNFLFGVKLNRTRLNYWKRSEMLK